MMGLMGLVFDLLWICGVAIWLLYLFNEVKKSQKELGAFNCQYLPLSTETWLVLVVITNASGWIIFWSRFLDFPYSWYTAVVAINLFRLFFRIKSTMPIILDLGVSLIVQWILSWGSFGWKWAFLLVFVLIAVVFFEGYLEPLVVEYARLMKDNPDAKPWKQLIYPLSPVLLGASLLDIYVVNGCLLLIAWFYPWNDSFYWFYQDSVGCVLVTESIIFLSCYKDICSKRDGLATPKVETGKPSASLSKKS
ncbi:hypothetical protein ACH5RR_030434 [Cinchona calisaya]|uniref:Uncharacterized protein n=1 Tax=Cinchona calisaya TaxID=153742 RepID=A0ABD2YUM9_9GENT